MQTAVGGQRPSGSSGSGSTNSAAASTSSSEGSAGATPERLSQPQVRAVMSPLQPAMRACTQGATGTATVAMVISHDGTVQNASVGGPFTPDVNACIQGVARRAHFPEFTRPTQSVVVPVAIH
jgi:hypothetical protein